MLTLDTDTEIEYEFDGPYISLYAEDGTYHGSMIQLTKENCKEILKLLEENDND